jgi:site-specific DNA recombinase
MEEQIKQMDEELPRLQAEIDFVKIAAISRDDILENARSLYERWPGLSHDEKRQITETLAEKITVGQGEIGVTLYHLPAFPSQKMANWVQTP